MPFKACPSYLFDLYCPYGSSCPFLHIPLQKTCRNFSKTHYCKFFPNCKYFHFDCSLTYIPQPRDGFEIRREKHLKTNLEQNIQIVHCKETKEILYNVMLKPGENFAKTGNLKLLLPSMLFYEEGLRSYLSELTSKKLQRVTQIKTLSLNFNANFSETFSTVFSILHKYIKNTEVLKLSLVNVFINDSFLMELIGILNRIDDLKTLQLSFQNCVLQKENNQADLLNYFTEKLKKIREFKFSINYDYSQSNNSSYEIILSLILEKLLQGNNVRKMELFLGLSNFDFLKSFRNIKFSTDSIIFQNLDSFSLSLSNLPDRNQMIAVGCFLSFIPKVASLSLNFLNHDKNQLSNNKINEKLVFDKKMAESLKNLALLKDLRNLSILFEEKIFKEAEAFDSLFSHLQEISCLESLEVESSNILSELKSPNILKILSNNQMTLKRFSGKFSYNKTDKIFLQQLFFGIQSLKNLHHLALEFEFSEINNFLLSKMSSSLENLPKLRSLSLNLSKNRISEEGCRVLGQAFSKLGTLETLILDLSFNIILDFGLKEIFGGIPRNIHDLIFLCERNGLSIEGVKAIKLVMVEKFRSLRKIYFDFLCNESIEKDGNFLLIELFEHLYSQNISLTDIGWETDYLEGEEIDSRLMKRKEALTEFLTKKKILACQMKKMKEKLRKSFRRELIVEIAIEKFLEKKNVC